MVIGFPILFIMALSFIYQSALEEIRVEQIKINCPAPIYEGRVDAPVGFAPDPNTGVYASYNITHNLDINGNPTTDERQKVGSKFLCAEDNQAQISVAIVEYGGAFGFTGFPYGWFVYAADTMTHYFMKIPSLGTLFYLYINAPAEVSGLAFFSYVNAVLLGLIGLGAFMVIRG